MALGTRGCHLAPRRVDVTSSLRLDEELYSMEVTADGMALARVYTAARSVLLTGRAAAKEVRYAQESPANQKKILVAMAREWSK